MKDEAERSRLKESRGNTQRIPSDTGISLQAQHNNLTSQCQLLTGHCAGTSWCSKIPMNSLFLP